MLLDIWRGARQVWCSLWRRPVRLCVGYGVGSTQKYKLGLNENPRTANGVEVTAYV